MAAFLFSSLLAGILSAELLSALLHRATVSTVGLFDVEYLGSHQVLPTSAFI